MPSVNHLFIQISFGLIFAYVGAYSLRQRISNERFFIVLFLFILVEIIGLRIWNVIIYNNSLGYNPIDSLGYDEIARIFATDRYSISDVIPFIKHNADSIDDYGFNIIICLIYKIFLPEMGIQVLLLLNAIAWIYGCYILYKLSNLLSIVKEGDRFIALLWGSFTYCVYTASTGLKENFFCMIAIITMYRLYVYIVNKSYLNLFIFIIVSYICIFFRIAVFFIFVCTLLFSFALKHKLFYDHLKFWICLGIIMSISGLSIVIGFISELRGNMALNQSYADAILSGNNLLIYVGTNILSVFTGTIPNFIADIEKQNYITLWNFGSFLRFLISGYSFYGIYHIIKHKAKLYYPMLIFIVLHSVMLIVTMFAIHDRYQMIQLPYIYILSVYGILQLKNAKASVRFFFNKLYILGATSFIIIFNILKFH